MPKVLEKQDDMMRVPIDLAHRLSQWHGSMSDPIYAVSSNGLAKRKVPRSVFMRAYDNMTQNRDDPRLDEHHVECVEICFQMQSELGIVPECDTERAIVSSMSRIVWSMAWADQAEEEDVRFYPQVQLDAIAPGTPKRCYDECLNLLREACEDEGYTISEFIAAHKPDGMGLYDFGYEVAMAATGSGGGDIDFRTKDGGMYGWFLEANYFDFKDSW